MNAAEFGQQWSLKQYEFWIPEYSEYFQHWKYLCVEVHNEAIITFYVPQWSISEAVLLVSWGFYIYGFIPLCCFVVSKWKKTNSVFPVLRLLPENTLFKMASLTSFAMS